MKSISLLIITVMVLILGPPAQQSFSSQNVPQPVKPAAALIAEKALKNARNSHDIKKQYSFRRTEIKESLNNNGEITETEAKTEIKMGKDFKLAGQNLDFYEILSTRFDFLWDERETATIVNGVECVVIRLRPKPNLPVRGWIDQVANRLEPVLYIELEPLSIQRITAKIPAQFSFWHRFGGFIPLRITISVFDIDMDMQMIDNLFWAENNATITARYSVAGISFYERYRYSHDQFKK